MEMIAVSGCACGCGQATPIAKRNRFDLGHVQGQRVPFISGHNGRRDVADRFWEKVDKQPGDGCWVWVGAKTRGYGIIGIGSSQALKAHRFSWEIHFGPIPPETPHVLHNCPGGDNPSCVRPDHLFLGDQRINVKDMAAKGRGWWQ